MWGATVMTGRFSLRSSTIVVFVCSKVHFGLKGSISIRRCFYEQISSKLSPSSNDVIRAVEVKTVKSAVGCKKSGPKKKFCPFVFCIPKLATKVTIFLSQHQATFLSAAHLALVANETGRTCATC